MADTVQQRRQPPSPLVFTPESVLSPPPSQPSAQHGSGSNTVSMPFVRRHVTRRLKAAKAECDKELQRVTNNITTFFEERLREGDDRDRDTDMPLEDFEQPRDVYGFQSFENRSAFQADGQSSDGGYDAELEYHPNNRHSRQPSSASSHSPASLRRQQATPWDKSFGASFSASSSGVLSSSPSQSAILPPEASITRKQPAQSAVPASYSTQSGLSSRRLSRTIHISSTRTSGHTSRSTSRSRSPLPPLQSHASFSEHVTAQPQVPSNRRASRILVDDPVDPIMSALYDIIGVATDVIDMSVTQLTSQPKICTTYVQRIQNIGKAWDEHPDWHGRNWYVQVLLAVASLSRVVEWWEAEKQFWNFNENDDEMDETLTFVMKPADEGPPAATPTAGNVEEKTPQKPFVDESGGRSVLKPTPQGKKKEEQYHAKLPSSSKEPTDTPSKTLKLQDSARVLATERLRLQAETAQNQNIVIEISLDGEHFVWINHAWHTVIGIDPEPLAETKISTFLYPPDSHVFREATQRLLEDDSHTVEARFRLRVDHSDDRESPPGQSLYREMEGKGMLMIDREEGHPSHTMWVVKPIGPARYEQDIPPLSMADFDTPQGTLDASVPESQIEKPEITFPFTQPICIDPIMCQICECQVPGWYFEKHSETCAETHRLEAEIQECNESISELRDTIKELASTVDKASPSAVPEYRGMPLLSPSTSPGVTSPLQLFRANKMQKMGVRKVQIRLLDQLEDILQVAAEIATPALKEEEANEPIERQRLLSPSSERKIMQVKNWAKPQTEDVTLAQVVQDAERVMRQKIDNVVRMQNTMRYAEKIWHEWEEKMEAYLAVDDGLHSRAASEGSTDEQKTGTSPLPPDEEDEGDDHSSTKSEYAFYEDVPTEVPPAPLAALTSPQEKRISLPPPASASVQPSRSLQTRSSTPSSVSSPLALAQPILPPSEDNVPVMNLDESPSQGTIKNPSPKVAAQATSPLSREASSNSKRGHRRQSTINPILSPSGPLSPRQAGPAPLSRTNPTSIKDFEIIKPISKGAFGSVFLAKKKVTGAYYAIKVLKKADMIAKNQITNVKAERMILMKQSESPFVAKLYYTFQSKDNLYLVMEYLNGGDCAALIKSLGCLPEPWTKNYVAEVTLGLEYLHQRGVVHRDLKPDNLLIDQHGHLKLTDFGLSRIGLLGRQTREGQLGRPYTRYSSRSRPPSMDSGYLSSPLIYADASSGGSYFNQRTPSVPRLGNSPYFTSTDDLTEMSHEAFAALHGKRSAAKMADSPLQSFATELTTDLRSHSSQSNSMSGTPPGEQKVVGTPDYLAPETILGLRGDDAAVDWWALGVITYEFLYGIPPFHAETPEKVFENILSGVIEWHEEWVDYSAEARDFMERLMTIDPQIRLGAHGAEEVKDHPFFDGIEWDQVTTTEAAFIPRVTDPESTDYFDPRGAVHQLFQDDDQEIVADSSALNSPIVDTSMPPPIPIPSRDSGSKDDFGNFSYKNLPVLIQKNDDVIRKLKTDQQLVPMAHAISEPSNIHSRRRSTSHRPNKKLPSVVTNLDSKTLGTGPPSPATSNSSIASSPSRASLPPSTPGSGGHGRKPSEFGTVERFKHSQQLEERLPSRLRTSSISSTGEGSGSETWNSSSIGHGSSGTPPSSVHSIDLRKGPDPSDRVVTCLLAEDNPITAKIIETLLIRLGCRCVVVADGSEAISVAMGDIKFDCILMDLYMPQVDGEAAARYIRSTNNKNTNTPIISVSAYSAFESGESSNKLFAAALSKPLQKADLLAVFRQLGFRTQTMQGGPGALKVTA